MTKKSTTIEFDLGNGFAVKRTRATALRVVRTRNDIVDQQFHHHAMWADIEADTLVEIYKCRHNPEAVIRLVECAMWSNQQKLDDLNKTCSVINDVRTTDGAVATIAAYDKSAATIKQLRAKLAATKRGTRTTRRAA